LKQTLEEQGLSINEGTLYPLLRRLEKQGLLESNWEIADEKRPRRYYHLSATGATILTNLENEWALLVTTMSHVLSGAKESTEKWKQTS
jgi:DNA-binding PadR family transcriptional regulator